MCFESVFLALTKRDGSFVYTTLYSTSRDNTTHVQHGTTQLNTTRHSTTRNNAKQHNRTRHDTTRHSTTRHNTTQHNKTQHNTTQHTLREFLPLPCRGLAFVLTIKNAVKQYNIINRKQCVRTNC